MPAAAAAAAEEEGARRPDSGRRRRLLRRIDLSSRPTRSSSSSSSHRRRCRSSSSDRRIMRLSAAHHRHPLSTAAAAASAAAAPPPPSVLAPVDKGDKEDKGVRLAEPPQPPLRHRCSARRQPPAPFAPRPHRRRTPWLQPSVQREMATAAAAVAVSRCFLACIGSPCLRHCGHGASIGGGGGGGKRPRALSPPRWSPEERAQLVQLVRRDGPGRWREKAEQLGKRARGVSSHPNSPFCPIVPSKRWGCTYVTPRFVVGEDTEREAPRCQARAAPPPR
jgi:hypothetical protein